MHELNMRYYFHHHEDGRFEIVDISGDGNCLFRAMAYLVMERQNRHDILRSEIVEHIFDNWDFFGNFIDGDTQDTYRSYMGASSVHGGEHEIVAFTRIYNCRVKVYYKDQEDRAPECYGEGGPTCFLLYTGPGRNAHYDVLEPTGFRRFAYDNAIEELRDWYSGYDSYESMYS